MSTSPRSQVDLFEDICGLLEDPMVKLCAQYAFDTKYYGPPNSEQLYTDSTRARATTALLLLDEYALAKYTGETTQRELARQLVRDFLFSHLDEDVGA